MPTTNAPIFPYLFNTLAAVGGSTFSDLTEKPMINPMALYSAIRMSGSQLYDSSASLT